MCMPEPNDFRRLKKGDAAVLSFGLGKCLYAGWGGLLLTRSPDFAARIRDLRNSLVARETRKTRLRHGLQVFASTAAHNRLLYGTGRGVAEWRNRRARKAPSIATPVATSSDRIETELSREWTEPMTPLNRTLALANLRRAAEWRELRRRKAAAYYRCLASTAGLVRGIDGEMLPESHFPIRVAANVRSELRQYLARRGIDTATYFPLPQGLKRADFPNAARASDEVILLPLGRCIRKNEIEMVARHVSEGLKRIAS